MKHSEKLTAKEEEVMAVLWKLKKAFVKEIQEELEGNQHYNTVSTLVRLLEDKGYVAYKVFGKSHQYFPVVDKKSYSEKILEQNSSRFFDGSYKNMVSFFAQQDKISEQELEEILELIKNKS
ncbi:BlaI/MecI/CopY family transcriptional regulator [Psychroflexus lacisalsi]|jgi:predicted transcriptional regulator|uniref:BlaI/MecI/CopY family transcriptional regulator n=1 Tax=Psychroflexus lacisalsi TaxID=503928 RepID=A0ABN1K234_9FLAO|nr:BlaI/MecI/CopY family transcriptional regulator [Psychroflexus lacisalsi]MBZ9621110.1 BlaI/MecI/CopY family transcriptional regulator [Psychroflexus lacisalsi]